MKSVDPQVFLVAETKLILDGIDEYLDHVGVNEWLENQSSITKDAELLVEIGGRLCYRSFEPGLNPNIVKVREGNQTYLENILKSKHGSVLEHSNVTFIFVNVTRVFTHELVRHRAGCAISQESLRFVRLTDIDMFVPDEFRGDSKVMQWFKDLVSHAEEIQKDLAQHFKLDDSGAVFDRKKKITSAMRRLAPIGLATAIMWTANFRSLRHVIEMRTAEGAEEEIRLVFDKVAYIVKKRYSNVFQDFVRSETGVWSPQYSKV